MRRGQTTQLAGLLLASLWASMCRSGGQGSAGPHDAGYAAPSDGDRANEPDAAPAAEVAPNPDAGGDEGKTHAGPAGADSSDAATAPSPSIRVSAATDREFGFIRKVMADNLPEHMRRPVLTAEMSPDEMDRALAAYRETWKVAGPGWRRKWMYFQLGGGVGASATQLARSLAAVRSSYTWRWECIVHHIKPHQGGAVRIYCSIADPRYYDFSILTSARNAELEPGAHIGFGPIGAAMPDDDDPMVLMLAGGDPWNRMLRVERLER